MSTSLDFQKFYAELRKIVDTAAGEGTMQSQFENNFESELEMSFQEDLLPVIGGRMTFVNWIVPPVTVNSSTTGFGIDLADKEKAEEILQKIVERINRDNEEQGEEGPVSEEVYKGTTYYVVGSEERRRQFEELRDPEQGPGMNFREPVPSFGIVGETFVISDSEEFVRQTAQGDHRALQDDPEMMEVLGNMTRLLGTDMPSAVMFSDPRSQIQWLLDLVESEDAQGFLNSDNEDDEEFVRRFKQGLRDNPPPKFEDIEKYFAPSGAFMTSDDTGFHFLLFQLKAK
jgi:hypothetical protein